MIIDDVVYKIITSQADNIYFQSTHFTMPDRPASCVYGSLPDTHFTQKLTYDYIHQRENALKEKAGADSHSFRDSSIGIFVLDDANMQTLLKHHENGNDGRICLFGVRQELVHPHTSQTDFSQRKTA